MKKNGIRLVVSFMVCSLILTLYSGIAQPGPKSVITLDTTAFAKSLQRSVSGLISFAPESSELLEEPSQEESSQEESSEPPEDVTDEIAAPKGEVVDAVVAPGKGNNITNNPAYIGNSQEYKKDDPEKRPSAGEGGDVADTLPSAPPESSNPSEPSQNPDSGSSDGESSSGSPSTNPPSSSETPKPQYGWYTAANGTKYYYNAGKPVTGWQAMDGVRYYFNEDGSLSSKVGIDVSSHQGNIDWKAVKASGVDFAMIRVGFRGWGSEGNIRLDSKFKQNILGATAAGIDCGVYFYSQSITVAEAIQEANFVLESIKGYKLNYPVAFDTEYCDEPEARTNTAGLNATIRTDMAIAFCNTIKNAGYYPMIYGSKAWFEYNLQIPRLAAYDTWLAHYTTQMTGYKSPFRMWQYTSTGRVGGIGTNVDRNIGLFDYATYIKQHGFNPVN